MVFNRFVEVGRVVLVSYGPDAGKIAVIVDIVDHNRALIEGPTTGVERQTLSFRRLSLTPLICTFPRGSRSKTIKKALEKDDIVAKWSKSSWSQKLKKREARISTTDFERFKLMVARKQKSLIVAKEFKKIKAAAKI